MKKRNLLLTCAIFSNLIAGKITAGQTAVIKVDLDRKIGKVDPNIYGAFVEPIRTVVYGSIYDPKSPLADENGFRKDFVQLIKEFHIPVVRWPRGNYVSGYNWEDGQVQIRRIQFLHFLHPSLHFLHKALIKPLFLRGRGIICESAVCRKGIDCNETERNNVKEALHDLI